jgi:hypothetical protein
VKGFTRITSAAPGSMPGAPAVAHTMTRAAYAAARDQILVLSSAAQASCALLADDAKALFRAEVLGREQVALAELDAADQPSRKARYAVRLARARAEHAIARERIGLISGS